MRSAQHLILIVFTGFGNDDSYRMEALCLFEKLLLHYAGVYLQKGHTQ